MNTTDKTVSYKVNMGSKVSVKSVGPVVIRPNFITETQVTSMLAKLGIVK